MNCKNCKNPGCAARGTDRKDDGITCYGFEPITNADIIRSMTDEELVFFFWGTVDGCGKTVEQWRVWLKQEVQE